MTTTPTPGQVVAGGLAEQGEPRAPRKLTRLEKRAIATKGKLSSPWASGIAIIIAILWTIPSLGLLITSFRPQDDIRKSGWWTVFTGNAEFTMEEIFDFYSKLI